jgi:HPt (histidine-containing phosphotransfer) domain-containing protein
MKTLLSYGLGMLLCSSVAWGEKAPILLNDLQGSYTLPPQSEVLADSTTQLTIQDVSSSAYEQQFISYDKEMGNFGMTGYAYWFKFKAQNGLTRDYTWLLGVEYALLDYIDVYYKDHGGKLVRHSSGDRYLFSEREIKNRHFYFQIPFDPGEMKEFYIRVQTDGSAEVPLFFKSMLRYAADDHESQLIQGGFMGFLLIFILYYLSLGIGARNKEYLLYALSLVSHLLFKGTMNGVTYEYFWPFSSWWANGIVSFTTPFVYFTGSLFTYYFLPVKDYPKCRIALLINIIVLGSCCISSFFLPYRIIKIYTIIGMLSVPVLLVTSSYMLHKGFKPAGYFLVSWIAMFIAAIAYGMQKLGVIEVNWFTINILEIAIAMQTLLLAIGQSAKIHEISKAIMSAQKMALEAQKEVTRLATEMSHKLEKLVAERTADLWKKTKAISVMMDKIIQGICTIDDKYTIQPEYSRYLEKILGRTSLTGCSLDELLLSRADFTQDAKAMINSAVQSSIGEDPVSFELNDHIFPRKFEIEENGSKRYLEADWAAIENQSNQIEKIMVAIRDITDVRMIEEKARNKEQELELIGQILHLSTAKFNKFIDSSLELIAACKKCLQRPPVTSLAWRVLLRDIHTIKGNSRTYGFSELTGIIHQVEEYLFSIDASSISSDILGKTGSCLEKIESVIHRYKEINDIKLERSGSSQAEKTLADAESHLREIYEQGYLKQYPKGNQISKLLQSLAEFTTDSFEKAIEPVIASIPSLARQLNKVPPVFKFEGDNFKIGKYVGNKIEDIFVHLIRNSLDHGFSSDETQGKILVDVSLVQDTITIKYHDTGRGLNLEKLKRKGLEHQLIHKGASTLQIANLIFESGISSADQVTDLSGRGVGMDAVQAFTKELSGRIRLELLGEPNYPYQKFQFVIELPCRGRAGTDQEEWMARSLAPTPA